MEGVATNAVIAVPDEKYGEVRGKTLRLSVTLTDAVSLHQVVGVFVARSHTHQDASPLVIHSHVRKHVGPQSAPAWVWYLGEDGVTPEFPKTASGKIQKVRSALLCFWQSSNTDTMLLRSLSCYTLCAHMTQL